MDERCGAVLAGYRVCGQSSETKMKYSTAPRTTSPNQNPQVSISHTLSLSLSEKQCPDSRNREKHTGKETATTGGSRTRAEPRGFPTEVGRVPRTLCI
ncbi:hypothetical protein L1887_00240 [Cichorium endivia]|nr:hypothetical protein L1887_00240 [Cichorium endivia]